MKIKTLLGLLICSGAISPNPGFAQGNSSKTYSSLKIVQVHGYVKKDGAFVAPYIRSKQKKK